MVMFEFIMEITDHARGFAKGLETIPGVDNVSIHDGRVTVVASTKEAQEKCRLMFCKFCAED